MIRINETKIDTPDYYKKVWATETNERPWYDAVRQRALLRHMPKEGAVLELGAGVFGALQYWLEHEKDDRDVALLVQDFSPTAAEIVLEQYPEILWVERGLDDGIDFDAEVFQSVIAGEVIEHMEDPERFVAECSRVLAPGGWLTLSTVDVHCANAKKLHPPDGHYPEHLWAWDDEDDLATLFIGKFSHLFPQKVGDYLFIEAKK